ncbi:hypothetical protein K1719_010202 [Acacia pycnantha]|nr:hypothetical protein K1719_010202 [Acacia pycnantha]
MGKYSDAHICQCLSRLLTSQRNLAVTITDDWRKTGEQFVHEVVALAYGLQEFGIKAGDVVAISAYSSKHIKAKLKHLPHHMPNRPATGTKLEIPNQLGKTLSMKLWQSTGYQICFQGKAFAIMVPNQIP